MLACGESSIAGAFAAQAGVTPERVALFDATTRLTYAQLAERCARAAAALSSLGVTPGTHVGMALPRSIDAAVAMLAIWWAGAVVVPIDPQWPPARRAWAVRDAELGWLIKSGADVAAEPAMRTLDLDALLTMSGATIDPQPLAGQGAALALYTSGSTGEPKAVLLAHRGLLARLRALAMALPWQADEVACHRTPPTFVDAYAELFGPLLHGIGSYVLPHPFAVADLLVALAPQRVTRLLLVPSLLELLLQVCPDLSACAPALRLVACSGEPLPPALARRFQAAAPTVRLINIYGSTEVSGDATLAAVPRPAPQQISIGRPLAGVSVHLIDEAGASVADGAVGELVVGGAVLALGYWKRPALTQARFVLDAETGAPIVRTGDRARRLADGSFELVGRLDDQVKIGGVRIELGEVERALLSHEDVRAAAAAVSAAEGGRGRLVAGVVTGGAVALSALRSYLAERLPAAALPSMLAIVQELPKNTHGKLDRMALAALVSASAQADNIAPGEHDQIDPLAQQAATWFAVVTERAQAGLQQELEHLGGDSLARLHLLAILEQKGWRLSPADLPRPLTPLTLAAALHGVLHAPPAPAFALDPNEAARLAREHGELVDAFPLTDFQRVMALETLANVNSTVWCDQVVYSLDGPLDPARLAAAWRDEVAGQPALRTTIAWRGLREPLQLVRQTAPFALEQIDVRHLSPAAYRQRVLAEEWQRMSTAFTLSRSPLFRVCLLRGPDARQDLLFTYHHVILDGESARQVLRSVLDRYAGRAAEDPACETFRSFVDRTRVAMTTKTCARWQRLLAGYRRQPEPAPPSPFGMGDTVWRAWHHIVALRARLSRLRMKAGTWGQRELRSLLVKEQLAPAPYAGGEVLSHPLAGPLSRALAAWAGARGTTGMALWAAAYALHLAHERGSRDVMFGVILSGRDGRTLGTVGMLANCLPLRVQVDERARLGEFIAGVDASLRELTALSHTPLLALARSMDVDPGAFLDTLLVSWAFAAQRSWSPPAGLRLDRGRGVTLAGARLALMLSGRGEQQELAVASAVLHRADAVRRHLLLLVEAMLAVPADADCRLAELLALRPPPGGISVGLPGL